jgi:hypothetical protein
VSDYVSRAGRAERLLGVDLDAADPTQVVENIPSLPVTRAVAANLQTAVRVYADFLSRQRRE